MNLFTFLKRLTFPEFLDYYHKLIEDKFLQDASRSGIRNPRSPMYTKMNEVYNLLVRMNLDPFQFLEDAFMYTDGIPSAWMLEGRLRYYKARPHCYKSIYNELVMEMLKVQRLHHSYDKFYEVFFFEKVNPFLACYDNDIKYFIWNNKLPRNLIKYKSYFEQVKCAFYLLDGYSAMRKFLKREWIPILKVLTKNRKRI